MAITPNCRPGRGGRRGWFLLPAGAAASGSKAALPRGAAGGPAGAPTPPWCLPASRRPISTCPCACPGCRRGRRSTSACSSRGCLWGGGGECTGRLVQPRVQRLPVWRQHAGRTRRLMQLQTGRKACLSGGSALGHAALRRPRTWVDARAVVHGAQDHGALGLADAGGAIHAVAIIVLDGARAAAHLVAAPAAQRGRRLSARSERSARKPPPHSAAGRSHTRSSRQTLGWRLLSPQRRSRCQCSCTAAGGASRVKQRAGGPVGLARASTQPAPAAAQALMRPPCARVQGQRAW